VQSVGKDCEMRRALGCMVMLGGDLGELMLVLLRSVMVIRRYNFVLHMFTPTAGKGTLNDSDCQTVDAIL